VLQREPRAGASEAGLDLVDDEQRAVAPAELLRGVQIARGRSVTMRPWIGSTMKAANLLAQLRLNARVTVRERSQPGSSGPNTFLETRRRPARAARVTPWKLLSQEINRAGPWPRVRTSSPSPRLAPVLAKNTASSPPASAVTALGEHAGQRGIVELDAVYEIRIDVARRTSRNVGMVVPQTGRSPRR